ncbi:hypothetical protein BBK82_33015 [Lentzea guizhouensis]|uniref:Uncharacterized protein n=1 Tax=Lentzea guizhouensis TaxID=1586287 RepID=A0A1B2HQY1_9PSEU|nr:hypothetical protein BBK82_33015 [Lentzea guizhouensis]
MQQFGEHVRRITRLLGRAAEVDVELAVGVVGADLVRDPDRQRRLAHTGCAGDARDRHPAGGAERGGEAGDLGGPPAEVGDARWQLPDRCPFVRVAAQDREVGFLERRARFQAELLREPLTQVRVDLQRLDTAVRALQRDHQLMADALPIRVHFE